MTYFLRECLCPGLILAARRPSWANLGIRIAQSLTGPPAWAGHNGLIIRRRDGEWCCGEAVVPVSKATPLTEYEEEIAAGKCQVRLYKPLAWTPHIGQEAEKTWWRECNHVLYDFAAYPRLLLACITGALWKTGAGRRIVGALLRAAERGMAQRGDAGWSWAHWCTEQVVDAVYRRLGVDLCPGVVNPAPKHIEIFADPANKRHRLVEVTEAVTIEGRKVYP